MRNEVLGRLHALEKSRKEGRCQYVSSSGNRCLGKSISHTVQLGETLRCISKNGHVSTFITRGNLGRGERTLEFGTVGISKASVFPGFCSKHDRELFAETESGGMIRTKRQAALIGYRVICLERTQHQKIYRQISER
jgi:hypothetical protein